MTDKKSIVHMNQPNNKVTVPTGAMDKLSTANVTSTFTFDGHSMYGHSVVITDAHVRCSKCNEKLDIPELIQNSSSKVVVAYKMLLYKEFDRMVCNPAPNDNTLTTSDGTSTDGYTWDPNRTHFITNSTRSDKTSTLSDRG